MKMVKSLSVVRIQLLAVAFSRAICSHWFLEIFRLLCFEMVVRRGKLLSLILALVGQVAAAQTIDGLEWVDTEKTSVARIEFGTNVRFLRQAPSIASDLIQVSFDVISPDDSTLLRMPPQSRRLAPRDGFPGMILTYSPMGTSASLVRVLQLQFTKKALAVVRQGADARTMEIEFRAVDDDAPVAKLPRMAESLTDRKFAVLLQVPAAAPIADAPRIPSQLQDYVVFQHETWIGKEKLIALAVGYFQSAGDAEAVQKIALTRFPVATVLDLDTQSARNNETKPIEIGDSKLPGVNLADRADAKMGSDTVANSASQADLSAEQMVVRAKLAIGEKRFREAVEILNRALMLPPNASSENAQELIGIAWEGVPDNSRAAMEYKLYQRLYPNGKGTERVAQRLAAINMHFGADGRAPDFGDSKTGSAYSYSGGISQFYFGGTSKSESMLNISAGIDQNTLSRTTQSALVTSLDFTGKYRSDSTEAKLVVRGNSSHNFVATSQAQSSLGAAYLDYKNLNSKVGLRLGRQSAISGSLFGLFDGASLSVPVTSDLRFSGSVGVPANTLVSAPAQQLYGVMLEADNLLDHWAGSMSLVDQKTEGISDRRALGLEVRYFNEGISAFSQLDYDLNFEKINAFTLQGSMQGPFDTSITVLVDDRKAPSLQLSDALISSGTTSLKTLLQLRSLAEVKDMALGTAAQARQAMVSVSRALSPKWQGSSDIRFSEIGELPAVGNFQAMPATGAQYTLSFQLTGSNLYSTRDVNGFNLSFLNSSSLNGTQVSYNNLTGILDNRASVEFSLNLYTQMDNTSTRVNRVSPGLRLSYKLTDRTSITGETIFEKSTTDGPTNHDSSSAYFFYIGYRHDIF